GGERQRQDERECAIHTVHDGFLPDDHARRKTTRSLAVWSTATPSLLAGLNAIFLAATTAASSRPWPRPDATPRTVKTPFAPKVTSSTTSPSMRSCRASSV